MLKNNFRKIKTAVISGVMAITAVAAPISAAPAAVTTLTAQAADSDNYAKLLQYSLYFFDANMCGTDVNSQCGMTWRGNCHTSDEVPGGFHDAGDHAMFGLPQGFTASTLGWAYYEFPDAFQETGQADHLKLITDYFCDFFKRSTKLSGDTVTNFLYQKGDGDSDHSYWGPPETQGSRQMFWTSNGASDIAAEYAAALAANYVNFGNAEDLKYAKALYKFSKQYNQTAPNVNYGSNSVADDQAWAAGWLYVATGDSNYLNDARSFPDVGWVHGWNDTHLGAACLYGEISSDWSAANGYISSKANGSNYMFLDKWGSARLNCSMQMTALIATKHGKGNYKDWAKGQMNYILGQNPANTCFITGYASNSAKNPHHRAASGYTSYEQFNMNGWNPDSDHMNPYSSFGSNSHTLIGALVGGPCDASGSYHDNMGDYICNEVAIDYNAGLVGAAAGLYHFYGSSGKIDSSIEGVDKIYSSSSVTPQPSVTTTTPKVTTTTYNNNNQKVTTTTVTNPVSSGSGKYELKVDDSYNYGQMDEDARMIGFPYKDFGLTEKSTEKIKKVEVKLSTSNGNIGKWQGAFGSSTKVAADGYWVQSEDMQQTISGSSGTITWTVDSATADIIQYGYEGELKFGIWWIDCQQFNIDSVTIYTDGTSTTTPVTTTTPKKTTTTTTTPRPVTTTTTTPNNDNVVYGDANENGSLDVADVVAVMAYVTNSQKYPMTSSAIKNCDVYQRGDGISINDAVSIQKYLTKLINKLPES